MNGLYPKILEIKQIVDEQTENVTDNYGLLSGLAGEILFLYYYEKVYGKQQFLKIAKKIDILTECVEKFNSSSSFCSGMSGVLYLIELLKHERVIDLILDNEIYNYIDKSVQYYIQNNKYELLYGLTGVSQYLLLRPDKYMKQLRDILAYFDNSKIIVDDTYAWKKNTEKGDVVDLALSHGMASIIYFLTKMFSVVTLQEDKNKIIKLIKKSCDFILSEKNFLTGSIYSYFPYSVTLSNLKHQTNSRLAWCYGDLSIGITLFNAGKILNDDFLLDSAESILINAAINRKNLIQNQVFDPGICHGASGIASVFYRMWWNTKNNIYLAAANYWINETLNMAKYRHGIAGYVYTRSNHVLKGYHLLEGISGIALSMLFMSSMKEPVWDKCVMIS